VIRKALMRNKIRLFLQKFGYDIVKYHQQFTRGKIDKESLQIEFKWLQQYQFKSIIDVGANEGQFSDKIRKLFPNANIFAFEPLDTVYEKLKKNFCNDNKFEAFNLGLGEEQDQLEFDENEYSPSSSFLKLSSSLASAFTFAVKTKKVIVNVDRMDSIFNTRQLEFPLLIKIDVQGFEDKVISGGIKTISTASLIICELSFVELYKGQLLFDDIFEKFKSLGFRYAGSIEQLRSPETNQILQADGIFIKQ
jgi:FkbM family methyltransferase